MKKLDTVLFIGTGGGNDVFSTTLAMASLWKLGWRWDHAAVAGVLSPFHHHTVVPTSVDGFFKTYPTSERFLMRHKDPKKIEFIDAQVSKLLAKEALYTSSNVFSLSLKNGSKGLQHTLSDLRKIFDYFVLVDLGGDFFYRGVRDSHVLSPLFDAMVLRAFVDSGVPGILFEAGPGTDGELEPEALIDAFKKCSALSFPLDADIIDWWDSLYTKWIKPKRPGRTIPITIEAFRSSEAMLVLQYRARAHLGTTRCYSYFDQRILTDLCRNFYLVDPKKIMNPFAVSCMSPKDWFFQTQVGMYHTNNEANLEYWQEPRHLEQFLTPSPLFPEKDRKRLIRQGVGELLGGVCNTAWVFSKDIEHIPKRYMSSLEIIPYHGIHSVSRIDR